MEKLKKSERPRILCCLDRFVSSKSGRPLSGGEYSVYYLLEKLSKEYDVTVLCDEENSEKSTTEKFCVKKIRFRNIKRFVFLKVLNQNKQWITFIRQAIEEFKPDYVMAQGFVIAPAVDVCRNKNIQTIVFVRAFENLFIVNTIENYSSNIFKVFLKRCASIIQKPIRLYLKYYNIKMLKQADKIVGNSQFIAVKFKEILKRDVHIICPFIQHDKYRIVGKSTEEYVTFIKPTVQKGVEVFIEIAQRMKNIKFLCVGTTSKFYKREMQKLSNVTHLEWESDMKKVYAQTKLLLIPSIRDEAFGRVCVEAMINRIPCIASSIGGIPEVIQGAGILISDCHNIEKWVNAITRLINDKEYYSKLSEKSLLQSKKFNSIEQYKNFEKIIT